MLAALRGRHRRVDDATQTAIVAAGYLVEARIKMLLTTSSHPPGTPTPSAPGDPPSLVTGTLRRSITVDAPTGPANRRVIRVGPRVVYGRIQELGGIAGRGAVLPPRPYVRPAFAATDRRVQAVFRARWGDAMNEG
jgi:phage gpG-like protein